MSEGGFGKLEKSFVKHLTPKAITSIKLNSHRVSTQKMYFSRKKVHKSWRRATKMGRKKLEYRTKSDDKSLMNYDIIWFRQFDKFQPHGGDFPSNVDKLVRNFSRMLRDVSKYFRSLSHSVGWISRSMSTIRDKTVFIPRIDDFCRRWTRRCW